MLLTKSCNIDNLLKVEAHEKVVVSWSLNTDNIVSQYELGTASVDERLHAAKLCQEHGYRIRFRIDPGIIYSNWQEGYCDLISKVFSLTKPENITIGMLRLLSGHLTFAAKAYGSRAKKLCNNNLTKGASDGKLRYDVKERIKFYNFLIDAIRNVDKKVSISLCRETPEVWQLFKNRCESKKCNCLVW
ncbi:MAG: spore photoproduct lyase family protein [Planctomycetota bacterium]|jgi:spore photoproduct lyase